MSTEDISAEQPRQRWFIDLDWFPENSSSFFILVRSRLCFACRERLGDTPGEIPADEMVATISKCCSKTAGFINGELPIMESIFRILVANGNQPLYPEELSLQLGEWRGEDSYRTSPEILSRLLESDRYYGLRSEQGEQPQGIRRDSVD
ncbi:hypothetical protein ACFLYR_00485 [Chloroflexota bacterium]